MSPTVQSLGLDQLSVPDRISLVQEILDSIRQDAGNPLLSDEQKKEMDRRWAAHEDNPKAAIPWEQVEAEALARLL